jgi:hypothetical protein
LVAPLNLSRTYLLTAFAGLTLGTDLVLQMFGRVSVNTQLVVVLRDAFWCKLNKYNLSMVVLDNKTKLGNPEFQDWLNKVRNSDVVIQVKNIDLLMRTK